MKTVACGISGGVDSAVSAYLLKKAGLRVIGVFMKNWDLGDENGVCTADVDKHDAQYVCDKLNIEFREVNFVKEYWNNVFEWMLAAYKKGLTPNPDIMCNKHIKFNKFADFCLSHLSADYFATGHYARTNSVPQLIRSVDSVKDQTFWLSQIDVSRLTKCIFPVGEFTKLEVKRMAKDIGFTKTLERKESMGICFIGKRRFSQFIDSYIEPKEGVFLDLLSGRVLGKHNGVHHFTLGQKSGLCHGQSGAYVAKMDHVTQEIHVVYSTNHPSLFMKSFVTEQPHWLGMNPLSPDGGPSRLRMQYQNKYRSIPCSVQLLPDNGGLSVRLDEWFRCVVPGQHAVLYSSDDRICLGSAQIVSSVSAWDEGYDGPIEWDINNFENRYIAGSRQACG